MSRIILLDFEEKDKEFLEQQKIDTFLVHIADFKKLMSVLPESKTIFYQMNWPVEEEAVPTDLSDQIQDMVKSGTRVICFVGKGRLYQLTCVTGTFPDIHLQDSAPGETVIVNPEAPFNVLFDKYFESIAHMYKLHPSTFGVDIWEVPAAPDENWKIVAKSSDGYPVSLLIKKGKGFFWLLPWFGQNNIQVADFILKDVFPLMELKVKEVEPGDWIDKEEYLFPDVKQLFLKREEERKKFEEKIKEIDSQIEGLRVAQQEVFNRLLKSEGKELKAALVNTFKYLGWTKVIDVDEYWKNVIRDKEEDIWLIDDTDQPTEVSLRKDFLVLVLARSGKNWATDDDCIMLQRFKGRRMQEFDNTRMKAILVGNYFNLQEAKLRNNPFSQFQVEEAEKDGNALITTYELFRAIKAEKEGVITKDEIRKQIKEKSGLIQFSF